MNTRTDARSDSDRRPVTRPGRHGDPLLRRIGRGLALPFLPSDHTRGFLETGEALQRAITTGRRIVVTRPRAGADEATVTALLASVFAHYRHDRVLTLDITPGSNSLARRLGVTPSSSLGEVARKRVSASSFEELAPHLAHVRDRLWMLPAVHSGPEATSLDAGAFQETLLPITRYFGVTLIDRGADVFDGFNRAAQASAHAHVLVAPATAQGAADIGRGFDWMTTQGDASLPKRIVVVLVEQSPDEDPRFDHEGAAEVLRKSGAEVVRVGYDRHLAYTDGLEPRRLSASTHAAATRIALEALKRAAR
ncbi:MinD/ParA family ATP-binding protein [Nocardiopsis halophila]|uniref:MinD/ParA family ATP-binding protein n=1 Tax=Nocardiopsis halophila TaxID=141692 RepID=UPI0003486EE5|nr:hypothetical protein [Nocardiopsis halophila]